jgi:hypothetical protein
VSTEKTARRRELMGLLARGELRMENPFGERPILRALRKVLCEMDDSTPILKEWRHVIQVAINVIESECPRTGKRA